MASIFRTNGSVHAADGQLRRALRPRGRVRPRGPGQPARQPGLPARRRHDFARRVLALLHPAAAGSGAGHRASTRRSARPTRRNHRRTPPTRASAPTTSTPGSTQTLFELAATRPRRLLQARGRSSSTRGSSARRSSKARSTTATATCTAWKARRPMSKVGSRRTRTPRTPSAQGQEDRLVAVPLRTGRTGLHQNQH